MAAVSWLFNLARFFFQPCTVRVFHVVRKGRVSRLIGLCVRSSWFVCVLNNNIKIIILLPCARMRSRVKRLVLYPVRVCAAGLSVWFCPYVYLYVYIFVCVYIVYIVYGSVRMYIYMCIYCVCVCVYIFVYVLSVCIFICVYKRLVLSVCIFIY